MKVKNRSKESSEDHEVALQLHHRLRISKTTAPKIYTTMGIHYICYCLLSSKAKRATG